MKSLRAGRDYLLAFSIHKKRPPATSAEGPGWGRRSGMGKKVRDGHQSDKPELRS